MKMYKTIPLLLAMILFGCTRQSTETEILKNRIDSLENKLNETYKPGFGEFMSSIQIHHNKLWFSGQNQNWKLADFEIHEIRESLEDIQKYQTERKESKEIPMIYPALDSLNFAIQQQDPAGFENTYNQLTNTCNSCHRATGFEFNVVRIPEVPPFSNQDFKKRDEN